MDTNKIIWRGVEVIMALGIILLAYNLNDEIKRMIGGIVVLMLMIVCGILFVGACCNENSVV